MKIPKSRKKGFWGMLLSHQNQFQSNKWFPKFFGCSQNIIFSNYVFIYCFSELIFVFLAIFWQEFFLSISKNAKFHPYMLSQPILPLRESLRPLTKLSRATSTFTVALTILAQQSFKVDSRLLYERSKQIIYSSRSSCIVTL